MEPATSPEELETLLEDALLQNDADGVRGLFEHDRVRVAGPGALVEGRAAADLLTAHGFVTSTRPVRICPDVAVGGGSAVTVSHRGQDLRWRLLVVVVPALA